MCRIASREGKSSVLGGSVPVGILKRGYTSMYSKQWGLWGEKARGTYHYRLQLPSSAYQSVWLLCVRHVAAVVHGVGKMVAS